jgi:hypothetical protein
MKKSTLPLFLAGCAVTGLLLANCSSDNSTVSEQQKEDVETAENPNDLCLVKPSWFPHSQTPAPAEGKGSPFDVSSTTNQIFHQWSWNKFLWLTKPDKGGNPLFLNTDIVKQVTTYMVPVAPRAGALVVLQDTKQAGKDSPVLQTNAAYGGTSETVYYSIHMNGLMFRNGVEFANQIRSGKIPLSNDKVFPVGSFELKVAWVPVTAIPAGKQSQYYTAIAALSKDGGTTFTNTRVALIGMHVVGVVENHPEFIWATFEHEDLSPDYDWKTNTASSTEEKLLFKQGRVTGIDGIRFNPATQLGYTPYQVFDLFEYGVPRNPGGGFMATSQKDEPTSNFNNIEGINACVHGKLDDVWKNYFYNGSIWLNMDGKSPQEQAQLIISLGNTIGSVVPGSPVRGSTNCANVTMESFTQTFQSDIKNISVNNLANCFSCHQGEKFKKNKTDPTYTSPLYLSHTFQDYLAQIRGASVKEVEDLKTQDEKLILGRMLKK